MWDNINFIINKKHPSSNIDKLQVSNKQYHHSASKFPKSNHHFTSYLRQNKSKFCFRPANEIQVFPLLENLDGRKSFGVDKVHPFLLSVPAFQIFCPATHLINLSINQGIFPDKLKIAQVIPVFKQGSRLDLFFLH